MGLMKYYKDSSIHDHTEAGDRKEMLDPKYKGLHISYGVVDRIDRDSYQITVTGTGDPTLDKHFAKIFLPLYSDREDIFLRWGELRKGLTCRVVWHGYEKYPIWGKAEIVGVEGLDPLRQSHKENDAETTAYAIFTGGTLG